MAKKPRAGKGNPARHISRDASRQYRRSTLRLLSRPAVDERGEGFAHAVTTRLGRPSPHSCVVGRGNSLRLQWWFCRDTPLFSWRLLALHRSVTDTADYWRNTRTVSTRLMRHSSFVLFNPIFSSCTKKS